MRIPANPATAALMTQFRAAMRSGEIPLTNAPFSDSAAARVWSPNRVNRNASASVTVAARTVAANHIRSPETCTDPME